MRSQMEVLVLLMMMSSLWTPVGGGCKGPLYMGPCKYHFCSAKNLKLFGYNLYHVRRHPTNTKRG